VIGACDNAAVASPTRVSIVIDLGDSPARDEHLLERLDLGVFEVGRADAQEQREPVGIGAARGDREQRSGLSLAQVVADRLARHPLLAEHAQQVVAELERLPSGMPIALSGSRSSVSLPASAAPRCSGRSTVYFRRFVRCDPAGVADVAAAQRGATRSSDWPTHTPRAARRTRRVRRAVRSA